LLASFIIVSFADLKKYKFHYWFAFPAIHSDPPWIPVETASQVSQPPQSQNIDSLNGRYLSPRESTTLVEAVETWSYAVDHRQRGFFLARKNKKDNGHTSPENTDIEGTELDSNWQIASLSEYENGFFNDTAAEDRYVCFADPSNYEQAPGWMLRNLLVLVRQRWGLNRVQILRYRDVHSKREEGRSMVIQLKSSEKQEVQPPKAPIKELPPLPKVTGWERNPAGKLSGRNVNLTDYMNPKR
jgi:ubiquitin-like modifier-activating enzyme ATG7